MLEAFIERNYLIIESNVVTNVCVWNGDTSIWTPPAGSIAIVQSTIPAMIWAWDKDATPPGYVLVEQMGAGDIGFTWDGTVCTTNQPKPPTPVQPITTGTTTI